MVPPKTTRGYVYIVGANSVEFLLLRLIMKTANRGVRTSQVGPPHGICFIREITLMIISPAYHAYLRVSFCTQKARNAQNCDLFHSRSMRMKTFCEFCGFCVRYYFLVSREGAKGAKIFINVITQNTLFFTLRRETVSSELQNFRTSEHLFLHSAWQLFHL